MKIRLSSIVITLLSLLSTGLAEMVTISTATGTAGADAYVMGGGTDNYLKNYGGATTLLIKEGSLDWCRKTYMRLRMVIPVNHGLRARAMELTRQVMKLSGTMHRLM
ncbi:MAG: hypothetical protein PF904_02725 [Kiritimatiellae bacterium]|jgi:hypothetical protein|nr:hypothetical protein [Kiritimatiellia bacterium]